MLQVNQKEFSHNVKSKHTHYHSKVNCFSITWFGPRTDHSIHFLSTPPNQSSLTSTKWFVCCFLRGITIWHTWTLHRQPKWAQNEASLSREDFTFHIHFSIKFLKVIPIRWNLACIVQSRSAICLHLPLLSSIFTNAVQEIKWQCIIEHSS